MANVGGGSEPPLDLEDLRQTESTAEGLTETDIAGGYMT